MLGEGKIERHETKVKRAGEMRDLLKLYGKILILPLKNIKKTINWQ